MLLTTNHYHHIMQEEIDLSIDLAEDGMKHSIEHLRNELAKIRSGKASPDMISSIRVDYYGSLSPISNVANVKAQDGRTLVITPWEKGMLKPIEQAIMQANIGIMPQNDGTVIRLIVPPLTEERRQQLTKQAHNIAEQAKVSVRNARREAVEDVRKAVKNGYPEDMGKNMEDKIQKLTDNYIAEVDRIMAVKEKDIMTV